MDAKTLAVKHAFQPICLANMTEWTFRNFTSFPVSTQRHLRKIVLMQKFTGATFHTQISQPMATHNRTKPGIMFGTSQVRALLLLLLLLFDDVAIGVVRIFTLKNTTRFAVGKRIEGFRDSMFEGVIFEVVFYCIDRQVLG
jgi:hypothetical protein